MVIIVMVDIFDQSECLAQITSCVCFPSHLSSYCINDVCVCVCVCVLGIMFLCVQTCMCMCACAQTCIYACTCMSVCMCVCSDGDFRWRKSASITPLDDLLLPHKALV